MESKIEIIEALRKRKIKITSIIINGDVNSEDLTELVEDLESIIVQMCILEATK